MKLPWQRTVGEDGKEKLEVSLPDELKNKIEASAKTTEELPKIKEMLEGLNSFVLESKKDREEAKAREAQALALKQREVHSQSQEELETLMLTDPIAASKKLLEPTNIALMTLRADNLRRETFEDAEKFPYYTGEFKSEVDKLLAGQTLASRNDPGVIEHAYYSTLGRMHEKIKEGKLKDRFASSEGNRGTGSGNTGSNKTEAPPEITDDIRKLAKIFGEKPEDYAKMLQDQGVGYV